MNTVELIIVGVRYEKGNRIFLKMYPMITVGTLVDNLTQIYKWLRSNAQTEDIFSAEHFDEYAETFGRYDNKVLNVLTEMNLTTMEYLPTIDVLSSLEKGTRLTKENFPVQPFGSCFMFDVHDDGTVFLVMSMNLGESVLNMLNINGYTDEVYNLENNEDVAYWEQLETNARMLDSVGCTMGAEEIYGNMEFEKYSVSAAEVSELIRTE